MNADPHGSQPILQRGPAPAAARAAVVLLHGRGGSAEDMLSLASELHATDVTYLAPQAAGSTWYPYSFLSPLEQNEPGISSALRLVEHIIERLGQDGLPPERIVVLGFSQGACLTLEFAVRHARRYGGIVGLSGGLIGPPGTPRSYPGSFDGAPVFLGCSDVDPHIPVERVRESGDVFRRLGATVDERIYRGMGHTVNAEEIAAIESLIANL